MKTTLLLAAALLLLTWAAPASAAPGQLDPSFDADGFKPLDELGIYRAEAVLIQPDGKIVVAAGAERGDGNFAIARLHPDGSIDTSFDDDGVAYVGFGAGGLALAVALQRDGKLVVAGEAAGNVAVTRLHPDGTLDTTFDPGGTDGAGKKIIDLLGTESAHDVLVQPDGKIVLAVSGTPLTALAVARLDPDGALDISFDGDGFAGVDLGGSESGQAVALQPDGKIVAAGSTTVNHDMLVARFNRTGPDDMTLDPGFGLAGLRSIDYAAGEVGGDVLVQPDGKLLVAGFGGSDTALAVTRLNPDGRSFDMSFDADGTSGADFGGDESGTTALLQPDGKVVLVGSTSLNDDIAVARLLPGGALDSTFSADGKATVNLGGTEFGYAAALQADGKIVIAGDTTNSVTAGAVVARLQGDGTPGPGKSPGPAGGGTGNDRPPQVSRLSLRPKRFRATGRRRGTSIRYTLSESARVRITIEHARAGRRVRGACRPARRSNRRAPRCTLWRRAGRLRSAGRQGANRRRFSGRLGGRPLTPGRYRLRLLAVDAAGQRSQPRSARFTVLRSPRP